MKASESLLNCLRERRTIRRFTEAAVDKKLIIHLIELATWAPSAGNRQDWFFTVITSSALRKKIREAVELRWQKIVSANRESGFADDMERYAANFIGFEEAPVIILVTARRANAFERHILGDVAEVTAGSAASAAMAAQNLMLAAHDLGLGSWCMTGAMAASDEISRMIRLKKKEKPICLIAIGWPAEEPSPPGRKPVEEVTRFLK